MTSSPSPPASSFDQPSKASAVLELVLASSLWGFGFVAAAWALESWSTFWVNAFRCILALAAGFVIAIFLPSLRRAFTWTQWRLAFWPGVFLAATLVIQTWGLEYTTATKSGFITVLYVLFVPLLERQVLKIALPRNHWLYVVTALMGVALICGLVRELGMTTQSALGSGLDARARLNIGDLITLLCALFASVQIFWFALIKERIGSAFGFNLMQTAWAGAISLALALIFAPLPTLMPTTHALQGVFALGLGSTLIAFSLQVRAQKKISTSLASLLFLLESPFAAVFAMILLGESLGRIEWLGGIVILFAVAAASLAPSPKAHSSIVE